MSSLCVWREEIPQAAILLVFLQVNVSNDAILLRCELRL